MFHSPTDKCLDVPTTAYIKGAMKAVYKPKTGGTFANNA